VKVVFYPFVNQNEILEIHVMVVPFENIEEFIKPILVVDDRGDEHMVSFSFGNDLEFD
jgi:hypothetical protein